MNIRRHLLEATTLVVAAILCATIANALAARERKLALVGTYPNALVVPKAQAEPPATPAAVAAATTTSAPAAQPDATVTTATAPAATAPAPGLAAPAEPKKGAPVTTPAAPAPAAPKQAAPPADILARFPPHENTAYHEISGDDAKWLHDQGALFLDARRTSIYEQGHIAGARSFAVWEADVDDKVNALLNEGLDQKKPIVVYCSGGECEDSHMLAQKLWGVFFSNVLVYRDGFPDWQKRGLPVATGARP